MRALVAVGILIALTGCSRALVELSRTHEQFLVELEVAMPATGSAQERAARLAAGIAQLQEETTAASERLAALADALNQATAGLDPATATTAALRGALEKVVAFQHRERRELEAAHAAREAKVKAVVDAIRAMSGTLPPVVARQRTITNYLEAHRGLPPLGGVSIAEPIDTFSDLLKRLESIGKELETQFGRAKEIVDAARKPQEEKQP